MPARYGIGRDGRRVGGGVVSESGEELGEADGPPVPSRISAGTSDADVSLSSVIAKAPEPIGSPPNGSSAISSMGVSPSRWTGAIGCVRAWRKPPSGVAKVNVTWRGPVAATVTSDQDVPDGPL